MEEQRKVRRSQRDYSLPFKLQVIYEVEKGEITYKEAQRKYGIQGRSTVLIWLRKHGTLDWRTSNPMKGKQTPQQKIRELEKKLKRLEQQHGARFAPAPLLVDMAKTNAKFHK